MENSLPRRWEGSKIDITGNPNKKAVIKDVARITKRKFFMRISLVRPFFFKNALIFVVSSSIKPIGQSHEQNTLPKSNVINKGIKTAMSMEEETDFAENTKSKKAVG